MRQLPAEIEIDVFSGRPNPRGQLTPEQTEELIAALDQPITGTPLPDVGLGYRGIIIDLGPGRETFRVFRGVIREEASMVTRSDDERRLERQVAQWARAFLAPAMAEWLLTAD
jgi:hypothetical protein